MGLEFTEATRSSNLLSGWVMDIYLIETNSQNRQGNEASVAAQGVKICFICWNGRVIEGEKKRQIGKRPSVASSLPQITAMVRLKAGAWNAVARSYWLYHGR